MNNIHKTHNYKLLHIADKHRRKGICFIIIITLFCIIKNINFQVNFKSTVAEDTGIKVSNVIDENIDEITYEQVSIKYILLWEYTKSYIFVPSWHTQQPFIFQSCKYYECYITREEKFFEDVTNFDVILFSEYGSTLNYNSMMNKKIKLPEKRSPDQIYLFLGNDPATSYPICDEIYDNYFNLTSTHKLDSDGRYNYFDVLNEEGEVIGPHKDMNWIKTEDMRPVPDDLMNILKGKTKLVAWIVSHCITKSRREEFVRKLEVELDKYSLGIDIYGECGKFECADNYCDEILEKRYMFYLAFENAFDEDYVTEKVMHALDNSVVPIVYGGANYTRFFPNGSYLNARELGVERLAATLNHLMHNKDEYYKFFKWRNHYSYVQKPYTDVCEMCRIITETKIRNERKVRENFREWWHPRLCSNRFQKY